MSETPQTPSESTKAPRSIGEVLLDIDGVIGSKDSRKTEVNKRDLADESRAARDKLAALHDEDPSRLDPAAVEAAKRELLEVEAERISRGGNPDAR